MNQLKQKIRFSTVAKAIDLTPKAFRNWLQRYDLHLLSDHKTRDWTNFTMADIAVLAITRELVRWGIGVEDANVIAFVIIKEKAGLLLQYRNTPAEALVASLQATTLCVHSNDDPEGPYHILNPESQGFGPADFNSCLWLMPQELVASAFNRIGAFETPTTKGNE